MAVRPLPVAAPLSPAYHELFAVLGVVSLNDADDMPLSEFRLRQAFMHVRDVELARNRERTRR